MPVWFLELPLLYKFIAGYLIIINAVTFVYFAFDKSRSTQFGARRVPEKTLYILIALAGTFGALMAMHYFRHKTKKASFQAMLILIMLVQLFGIILLLNWINNSSTSSF